MRRLSILLSVGLLAVACTGDPTPPPLTTTTVVPAPSAATTTSTVAPPPSTESPTTTSTTTTVAPTTTVPPADQLIIRPDGLGTARFGVDADAAVAYVSALLGAPSADGGLVDSAPLGICPAKLMRMVSWQDLTLYFGADGEEGLSRATFLGFRLAPAAGASVNPAGLHSAAGIAIGADVARVAGAYPFGNWSGPDPAGIYLVEIGPGFTVELNGHGLSDVVVAWQVGQRCRPAAG